MDDWAASVCDGSALVCGFLVYRTRARFGSHIAKKICCSLTIYALHVSVELMQSDAFERWLDLLYKAALDAWY